MRFPSSRLAGLVGAARGVGLRHDPRDRVGSLRVVLDRDGISGRLYGLERKADGHSILEATVIRGALAANFISPQRDLQSLPSLLTIARSYSEKCEAARKK